jgi:hypothetical protein
MCTVHEIFYSPEKKCIRCYELFTHMKTAKKGGGFEPSVQHETYRSGARICIEFFTRSRASNDEVRSFVRSFIAG